MISLLERDQIISSDTGKQVGLAYANEDTSDLGSFLKSERTGGGGGGKKRKEKGEEGPAETNARMRPCSAYFAVF